MDAGTATKPAELPMDELDGVITRHRTAKGIKGAKAAFEKNQIPAKISMFDTDPAGFVIISQTDNGYMTRHLLNPRQALRLAIALQTYVAGQL